VSVVAIVVATRVLGRTRRGVATEMDHSAEVAEAEGYQTRRGAYCLATLVVRYCWLTNVFAVAIAVDLRSRRLAVCFADLIGRFAEHSRIAYVVGHHTFLLLKDLYRSHCP
jgi:hypothetical protein